MSAPFRMWNKKSKTPQCKYLSPKQVKKSNSPYETQTVH